LTKLITFEQKHVWIDGLKNESQFKIRWGIPYVTLNACKRNGYRGQRGLNSLGDRDAMPSSRQIYGPHWQKELMIVLEMMPADIFSALHDLDNN
jgi:hypothetical protein